MIPFYKAHITDDEIKNITGKGDKNGERNYSKKH